MDIQEKIKELLTPLFAAYEEQMVPASEGMLKTFRQKGHDNGVPGIVIEELVTFYQVTNGVPCLDSFDFHACNDEIIYEWWGTRELWLAQRDFYTLRWSHNKFCLGDAANVSFSEEHEYQTLLDLLENALREWGGMEKDGNGTS